MTISVAGSSRVPPLSASVIDSGTTVIDVGHKRPRCERGLYLHLLDILKISSVSEFLSNCFGIFANIFCEYLNSSGWRPLGPF